MQSVYYVLQFHTLLNTLLMQPSNSFKLRNAPQLRTCNYFVSTQSCYLMNTSTIFASIWVLRVMVAKHLPTSTVIMLPLKMIFFLLINYFTAPDIDAIDANLFVSKIITSPNVTVEVTFPVSKTISIMKWTTIMYLLCTVL